jgi:hypothetical protein
MDKVKLYAQERLDLDDTRALQSLTEDYLQESFGALLGFGGGALSVPVVTTEENSGSPYITFSPFTFVTTTPNFDRGAIDGGGSVWTQAQARIVNYDPTEESAPEIDITTLRGGWDVIVATFGSQYIWARPILVDTDTGTRRKWDVTSGAETTFSAETRTSQRVEFAIQNAEPIFIDENNESRWTKIGQITGWTDGTNVGSEPSITWFNAFDSSQVYDFLNAMDSATAPQPAEGQMSLARIMSSFNDFPSDAYGSLRSAGLITQLAAMRRQITRLLCAGINDPGGVSPFYWDNAPLVSLAGAHSRLSTLEARQTGAVQFIASARVAVNVVDDTYQRYSASYFGPSYGVNRTHAIINDVGSPQNRANICLNNDLLAEGWAITHVDVTQIKGTYALDGTEPNHLDYNRVSFVVPQVSYAFDTSDTSQMLLDNGASVLRGVIVEFLPWIMDDGGHQHSEDAFHAPNGDTTVENADATRVLTNWPAGFELTFSVAVYAVATDNADT